MVFFGNARPKPNARAHLKQRKKHSGLTTVLGISLIGEHTDTTGDIVYVTYMRVKCSMTQHRIRIEYKTFI